MKSIIAQAESEGKSFHGLLASKIFDTSYEDIMESADQHDSEYAQAKKRVFAYIYGTHDKQIASIE